MPNAMLHFNRPAVMIRALIGCVPEDMAINSGVLTTSDPEPDPGKCCCDAGEVTYRFLPLKMVCYKVAEGTIASDNLTSEWQ